MRYKAVVFDMDGTILDTLDDLAGSVNHSLAMFGYPLRSRDEIRSFLGNGMIRLIHLSVPEGITSEEEEAVLNEHKSYYRLQLPIRRCIGIIITIEFDTRKCYSFHRQWNFLGSVVLLW